MSVSRFVAVLAILVAIAAGVSACGNKLPGPASPSDCGDRCAAMTCPAGSTCTLTGNCTPRCEPQALPMP
jgi:hypothetical protein